jgi:hypothetical protein
LVEKLVDTTSIGGDSSTNRWTTELAIRCSFNITSRLKEQMHEFN